MRQVLDFGFCQYRAHIVYEVGGTNMPPRANTAMSPIFLLWAMLSLFSRGRGKTATAISVTMFIPAPENLESQPSFSYTSGKHIVRDFTYQAVAQSKHCAPGVATFQYAETGLQKKMELQKFHVTKPVFTTMIV